MNNKSWRWMASYIAVGIALTVALISSCRTTSTVSGDGLKNTGREAFPVLRLQSVDKETVDRLVSWSRPDAEAMFGDRAYFHMIAFDDVMTDGPCQSVLGARILFTNSDPAGGGDRPYAMVALNPIFNGEKCVYGSQAVTKQHSDVKWLVSGTRNIELQGGTGGMSIGLNDAIGIVKKSFSTFANVSVVSVIASEVPGMTDQPWALVSGLACGQDVSAYVNLTSGAMLPGPRPIKPKC